MLPLAEAEKAIIPDNHWWQCDDDMPRMITELYITEQGELKINIFDIEPIPDEELPVKPGKRIFPLFRRINEHLETIRYNGDLDFSRTINNESYSFTAFFVDGKLQKISYNKYFDFE